MPYKSDAQRRFMHARHPDIAKRWDKEHPNQKNLPEKRQQALNRRLSYQQSASKRKMQQANKRIAPGEPNPSGRLPRPGKLDDVVRRRNMLNQFKKQAQKAQNASSKRGVASKKAQRRIEALNRRIQQAKKG